MARIDIKSNGTGGGGGSGTVTSVSIATGTSGTNVNATGTVTTAGTLTVNIPVASATNTGKLSNTDWTTFNNKGNGTVTSVGVTSTTLTVTGSPVTGSGNITANIPDGYLKLASGVSGSLQNVTDTDGTATTLFLSSTAAQFTSPLRITTSDASGFYLDAEDSATNNRFSIKRDPSAQEVTLDFASNPAGSTTLVGAIRTYRDGTNLSNAMSFIEDGSVGVGTSAPIGLMHFYKAAATTRVVMDGDAGQSKIITFRTAGLQRWGLYTNNVAESGSNAGSNFVLRRYSDAGTLLSTSFQVNRQTGLTTISDGLDLAGSELKNFSADQNAGGALAITSANTATYNGTVYNVTGAVTISVDNTVPDGFSLTIIQQDANQCTVAAGTGLTLRNRQSHTQSAGQWAVISIIRTGSDLILGGDTA
jgi:hypothetical protein